MALDIRKVEHYSMVVGDQAAEGAKLLAWLAGFGVNLVAFKAVPAGPAGTRFTLLPEDGQVMAAGAEQAGLALDGPHPALLIEGDDQSGALADIYERLAEAGITVSESSGIAGINGGYGVVLYLAPEDCDKAAAALGM